MYCTSLYTRYGASIKNILQSYVNYTMYCTSLYTRYGASIKNILKSYVNYTMYCTSLYTRYGASILNFVRLVVVKSIGLSMHLYIGSKCTDCSICIFLCFVCLYLYLLEPHGCIMQIKNYYE